MANKFFKIGLAVISIIFGIVETVGGGKDLVEAIKEQPEETEETKEETKEEKNDEESE